VIPRKEFQNHDVRIATLEKSASDALKLVRSLEQDLKRVERENDDLRKQTRRQEPRDLIIWA